MANPKRTLKLEVFSGFHDPNIDAKFLSVFLSNWEQMLSTKTINLDVALYGVYDLFRPSFVRRIEATKSSHLKVNETPDEAMIIFLGFSAGCIRATLAANFQKAIAPSAVGLIAIDGWGVPLVNSAIPSYRFSHDLFTHLSSASLGGQGLFFADPPAPHLSLWKQSDQVKGWYCPDSKAAIEMNQTSALILSLLSLLNKTSPQITLLSNEETSRKCQFIDNAPSIN